MNGNIKADDFLHRFLDGVASRIKIGSPQRTVTSVPQLLFTDLVSGGGKCWGEVCACGLIGVQEGSELGDEHWIRARWVTHPGVTAAEA